ncbi:hypothetical protein RL72_00761 [Microbacterium azadirachtae]|uniref:Uncharacterized protein n=1 Tax=Microbacterium azadirachtae TaxID=582680 RepID=A0A0F0L2D9_9MICO|nr:hypothetical protein RL72_00761 [Microbacterium azadirachtae]
MNAVTAAGTRRYSAAVAGVNGTVMNASAPIAAAVAQRPSTAITRWRGNRGRIIAPASENANTAIGLPPRAAFTPQLAADNASARMLPSG